MKSFVKSIFVLAMLLIASFSFTYAQKAPGGETGPAFNVGQKWLEIKNINPSPNHDSLDVGDTIFVSLGGEKTFYIADPIEVNSKWAAAVKALREKTGNYKDSPTFKISHKKEDDSAMLILLILLCATIIALIAERIRKQSQIAEAAVVETSVQAGPPMIDEAPAFETITKEQMRKDIELVTTRTFHRKFRIIGEVLKGWITGRFVSFFADGSNVVSNFKNEPGYLAYVLFEGEEELKQMVCQAACFNPLYTAVDAEFDGIFLIQNEKELETGSIINVDRISPEEIKQISHGITMPQEEINLEEMADERVSAPVVETKEKSVSESKVESVMKITRLQISYEKGLNVEGEFSMEMKEFKDILTTFKNK
ncbi:MAG: hypothetical protein NDI62_00450 [Burkholderiales bacterium]|nr:hypothetical protein [Burkholderiales bacterium]